MNIRNKYIIILICLIAFAVLAYFFLRNRGNEKESLNSGGFRNLKTEAFKRSTGWGYRIYSDTSIIIEQVYIPGVADTLGFKTEISAIQTAKLVQQKLQNKIFPPTVTFRELDSMGVNYK